MSRGARGFMMAPSGSPGGGAPKRAIRRDLEDEVAVRILEHTVKLTDASPGVLWKYADQGQFRKRPAWKALWPWRQTIHDVFIGTSGYQLNQSRFSRQLGQFLAKYGKTSWTSKQIERATWNLRTMMGQLIELKKTMIFPRGKVAPAIPKEYDAIRGTLECIIVNAGREFVCADADGDATEDEADVLVEAPSSPVSVQSLSSTCPSPLKLPTPEKSRTAKSTSWEELDKMLFGVPEEPAVAASPKVATPKPKVVPPKPTPVKGKLCDDELEKLAAEDLGRAQTPAEATQHFALIKEDKKEKAKARRAKTAMKAVKAMKAMKATKAMKTASKPRATAKPSGICEQAMCPPLDVSAYGAILPKDLPDWRSSIY